ncbi:ATP synthase F1 complex subunit gamma [Gammaproteobacteria bacterium]
MSGGKDIRDKIKSIKSTQKITRAMEMVAASKMRRFQDRMSASRPYADKMRRVIGHMAHATTEYPHPYLVSRKEVKSVGYVVITSDRGLCGGLNSNLLRALMVKVRQGLQDGQKSKFCTIGGKGALFLRRMGGDIISSVSHLGDKPHIVDLIGAVKVMLDAYVAGEIDRLFLVYNHFVNTMVQAPTVEQLLPLPPDAGAGARKEWWDYLYEPDPRVVIDELMVRFIESLIYQGVVENMASEMASRMVAMKSASDNAADIIGELQLAYNKARQAAITQELSEIVGGAAAV